MAADDTLPAAVAVCVMDWVKNRIPWAYEGQADVWHTREGVPVLTCCTWRPDEDDAQAMQVLDRMAALGFDYSITSAEGHVTVQFASAATRAEATAPSRRAALLEAAAAACSEAFT